MHSCDPAETGAGVLTFLILRREFRFLSAAERFEIVAPYNFASLFRIRIRIRIRFIRQVCANTRGICCGF